MSSSRRSSATTSLLAVLDAAEGWSCAVKDVFRVRRMWRPRGELKRRYDVVIVGGGSHGLATAYYLAKRHGITRRRHPREVVHRLRRLGPEHDDHPRELPHARGRRVLPRERRALQQLSAELDFNLMFSQHGHLTLAHSDRGMVVSQERAEVNKLLGIDSTVVTPEEIKEICPQLDVSDRLAYPILGALYHRPGGIIRHDAVVWGYARGADRHGVEIHPYTEVTGLERDGDRITAVETNRGRVECGQVVSATAGWSSLVAGSPGCGSRSRPTSSRPS